MRVSLNFVSKSRFDATLTLVALSLVLVAVITIARSPKATGYEMNIYDSLPLAFWYCLIGAIAVGQIVILKNAFSTKEFDRSWIQGLLPMIMADAALLLIPAVRGYPVYGRGDVMTHVGYIQNILNEGNISTTNMYPIDHVLAVDLSTVSGLDILVILYIISFFFSLFYILSFMLLARKLLRKKASLLISFVLIPILFFGNSHFAFSPFPQSHLLLPFILLLFLRWRSIPETRMKYALLVLLTSICLVFFHPLTSLALIVIFIIADPHTYSRIKGLSVTAYGLGTTSRMLLVIVAVFVTWHTYLYLVVKGATHILDWFALKGFMAKSEFQSYSDLLGVSKPSMSYLANYILSQYGQTIILGVVSLCCILLVIKKTRRVQMRRDFNVIFSSFGFVVFSTLAVSMGLLATIVGFGRLIPVVIMFSCVLISAATPYIIGVERSTPSHRRIMITLLCVMAILLTFFSTFNLLPSPKTNSANYQVTDSEIDGMKSFFETRDFHLGILEFGPSQRRWHDAIYGTDPPNDTLVLGVEARPIDHFGYVESEYFGSSYNQTMYFLLSDWGRQFYPSIYPEFEALWRFSPGDFDKLKADPTVNLISANGNLEVYLVNPT